MPINTPNLSRLFQTAGQQKQQQGTGYTNLNRLFQASSGNQLGQKVAGNIQQQIGNVQSQLGEQQKQFQTESEKGQLGGEADIAKRKEVIGRFTDAPTDGSVGSGRSDATQPSTEDLASFEKFRAGQYGGPQGLKDIGGLSNTAAQLKGQVSNFSPSGTQELLRRSVGGDRYTQGQQRLDSLLMNRSALTPVQRQASGLGQQINRADLAASGQAELAKSQAQKFGEETGEQLTAGMTGIDTSITGKGGSLEKAMEVEKNRQNILRDIMYYGTGSREQLDEAGKQVLDPTSLKALRESYGDVDEGRSGLDRANQLRSTLLSGQINSEALDPLFGTQVGAGANQNYVDYSKLQNPETDLWNRIYFGAGKAEMVLPRIRSKLTSNDQFIAIPGAERNAYQKALTETGKMGQAYNADSFMNTQQGSQSGAINDLLTRIAQSTQSATQARGNVEGLTAEGVASAQQRSNYGALAQLLKGKGAEESAKYRISDPSQYKAGKILIDPNQI